MSRLSLAQDPSTRYRRVNEVRSFGHLSRPPGCGIILSLSEILSVAMISSSFYGIMYEGRVQISAGVRRCYS